MKDITFIFIGIALVCCSIVNHIQTHRIEKLEQQIIEITKQVEQLQQVVENKTKETK